MEISQHIKGGNRVIFESRVQRVIYFLWFTFAVGTSLIQGYIHQHVWLLFTILSLSTGEIVTSSHVDLDYVKLAAQLQSQCMQIITHCLKQVPDDTEGMLSKGDKATCKGR